ncbi:uncharacterized protein LOC114288741 [Camellia sinensis]|uniref:uncharacterized protein LOC114288741 n=1 Tax=Camellia sinensis TaxID=4442 RepID=UPI001035D585|nr:uncharacterized protein LOC114288741 [Camellia sinensis]
MGRKKAVADNLLAYIPNIIDSEDTLPISKIAEAEKSATAAEKRLAEAVPSESTWSKRPRSASATTSGSMKSDAPWVPPITIEDKPVRAGDSTTDIEVGVALFTALLLSTDLDCNAEFNEYENFTLMLQHSAQAIQHGHSFAIQAFTINKEFANKTREAVGLQKTINKAEAKMKTLIDQAEAAKKAQDEAEEKADAAEAIAKVLAAEKKETEAKIVEAQKELQDALATKEAEIKAADGKTYAKGAADIGVHDCKIDDDDGEGIFQIQEAQSPIPPGSMYYVDLMKTNTNCNVYDHDRRVVEEELTSEGSESQIEEREIEKEQAIQIQRTKRRKMTVSPSELVEDLIHEAAAKAVE